VSQTVRDATHELKHIFGPVPSRRLGFSLGVDLVVPKTCSMDCIYCELGPTTDRTVCRSCPIDVDDVLRELERVLSERPRVDYVTLSGSGEPTLNSRLDDVIRGVRRATGVPVAVLTNASLMTDPAVSSALDLADVVLPSLDAVSPEAFERVNRPHPSLDPSAIVRAVAAFSRSSKAEVWLESVFVSGVNDGDCEVDLLRAAIEEIAPERVHVNTVVRPPAVPGTSPVSPGELAAIARKLGPRAEVIAKPAASVQRRTSRDAEDVVVAMAARRPITVDDVATALGMSHADAGRILGELVEKSVLTLVPHGEKLYYKA
jgi:wyosine [tRNA(Phe)-imidazoG37] synthetase (radical SAM superfamily)